MESTTPLSLSARQNVLADLSAGLVVFLVALPLCLGIALASGAQPIAGIVSGIVGGVVVGALSRSHTSVSGPAAGLTAVVAAQIVLLGSYEAFLTAVVLAGLLQVGLGVVRAGSIADFVPSSVIKGLLAAIGLILILKQIPYLVGYDVNVPGEMSFRQPDHETTFSELVNVVMGWHPGALLVGIMSMLLLLAWDKSKWLKRSQVPGPLVAVVFGVSPSMLLGRIGGAWEIGPSHLVQMPVAETVLGFFGHLQFPELGALANPQLYFAAVTIALVASLETLLNLEAVDRLDPQKRVSPTNRELIAQGVGNLTAGLLGGLPVTSVIVRSSVNINTGGKTKLSTIVHGLLLLLCAMLLPGWLNMIPLSCLAAVLILTGFKLAKPKLFQQMWKAGWTQFLPFIVTVSAIVLTDLLIGILIGLGFSICFILHSNLRRPLHQIVEKHIGGDVLRIELANQVSFLNRVALSRALTAVPRGGHVLIDARQTDYIDADVQTLLWEYIDEIAPTRAVKVSLVGLKKHYEQLANRVQYVDYSSREMQSSLTPDRVLQILRDGNERFRTGQQLTRDLARQLEATAVTQHPLAIVLSGTSSRTPVEMIFDVGLGEIYCARVSGNLPSVGVLGSLEYACGVAGAKLIVILGHHHSAVTRLAVESFVTGRNVMETTCCQHLDPIVAEIHKSIDPKRLEGWQDMPVEVQRERMDELYRAHIAHTSERVLAESLVLYSLVKEGRVKIVGAMYDVRTGAVDFFW